MVLCVLESKGLSGEVALVLVWLKALKVGSLDISKTFLSL
jgi:hypothetical protein